MYVIMVYDVNVTRVSKILKIGRRYLTWVQNSVLEGELSWAQLARLEADLRKAINDTEDSVLFYVLRNEKWLERRQLGRPKENLDWLI